MSCKECLKKPIWRKPSEEYCLKKAFWRIPSQEVLKMLSYGRQVSQFHFLLYLSNTRRVERHKNSCVTKVFVHHAWEGDDKDGLEMLVFTFMSEVSRGPFEGSSTILLCVDNTHSLPKKGVSFSLTSFLAFSSNWRNINVMLSTTAVKSSFYPPTLSWVFPESLSSHSFLRPLSMTSKMMTT